MVKEPVLRNLKPVFCPFLHRLPNDKTQRIKKKKKTSAHPGPVETLPLATKVSLPLP